MKKIGALLIPAALLLAFAIPAAVTAQTPPGPELFTAFAAALGTGKTAVVEIRVTRWSTDAERQMLLDTLIEKGQDGLLGALEKIRPPCGTIRTTKAVAWDLYYARSIPQPDGGRRVILGTNRRVNFAEAANNLRSMQYQFTMVEIHFDKNGKGEGKLVPAAKVSWDAKDKRIEIENYNALPVDLLNVQAKPM
jgi:hypothetical protein